MESLCKKCGICCKYIPVDVVNRKLLWNSVQPLTEEFESMLLPISDLKLQNMGEIFSERNLNCDVQIFKCKHLINENHCSNPNMPNECKDFPSKPFAFIPDECGYYGEQFLLSEDLKQKIRKMKEEILNYEVLMTTNPKESRSYVRIIEQLNRFIQKYSVFGSEDW